MMLTDEMVPAHVEQMVLIKEEAPEEWRPGVDQLDPEALNIKEEEEEEPLSRLEGEQLNVKEETDVSRFSVTAVTLKSEDDEEKPLLSQLHQHQVEDRDLPSSSSADGEDCGGAETSRNPDLQTHKDHSSSSETELSEDYEDDQDVVYPDSQLKNLSDSGSKTKDSNKKRQESRTPVSTVNTATFLSCSECGKQYVNSSFLQRHMTCHPGAKTSSCLADNSVGEHVKSNMKIQTEPKSLKCHYCNKRFTSKKNLNTHMRVHTGDKPYPCDLCGQRFSQKSSLNTHIRIHTGEKPFPCDVCGHRFSQKASLNSHMRIHTGEKPFSCNVCKQKFNQKHVLITHKRTHTGEKPFSCHVCGLRFSQKSSLNTHVRIHTGGKTFPCLVCGQKFIQKHNLNSHMRVHIGNNLFPCRVCGQKFIEKQNLNVHMRIHTVHNRFAVCLRASGDP